MDIENRLDILDSRLEHFTTKVEMRIDTLTSNMKDEFAEMRMLLRTINSKLDRALIRIDDHENRMITAGI